jgi:hypothetical protein
MTADDHVKKANAQERAKDAVNATWDAGYRAGLAEGKKDGILAMRDACCADINHSESWSITAKAIQEEADRLLGENKKERRYAMLNDTELQKLKERLFELAQNDDLTIAISAVQVLARMAEIEKK